MYRGSPLGSRNQRDDKLYGAHQPRHVLSRDGSIAGRHHDHGRSERGQNYRLQIRFGYLDTTPANGSGTRVPQYYGTGEWRCFYCGRIVEWRRRREDRYVPKIFLSSMVRNFCIQLLISISLSSVRQASTIHRLPIGGDCCQASTMGQ